MGFNFTLNDTSDEDVPPWKVAVEQGLDLVSKIKSEWTKGKAYPHGVQTYHTKRNGDFWMARVSEHRDIPFDWFRRGILHNHTSNEVKYIHLLDSYREVTDFKAEANLERWYSVIVHYKFPRLFSDREMAVWILAVQPDESKNQFVVISIPSDRAVNSAFTQAVYCSIEVVTLLDDGKTVEWLMAQTSDARGSIPRWIQDKSVTASVAADVPEFLDWAKDEYADDPPVVDIIPTA